MTKILYPRVTEILKPFSGFDYVSPTILKRAAARGSSVHALCAGIAKGAWLPDSMIDEELKGYVDSFKKWAKAQVKEFKIIEKRYCDEVLGFTGQVDFVLVGTDEEIWLVDLKTSSHKNKTYPLQMAAYVYLLNKNSIR